MKCPNCKKEISDGAKFCSECGEKILLSCPNNNCPYYGKNVLPPSHKFCPECGTPLDNSRFGATDYGNNNSYEYGTDWSSLEDFKNGDIIVNGVALGVDSPVDLINSGYVPTKAGFSSMIIISDGIYVMVPLPKFEEIENVITDFSFPQYINRDFFIHAIKNTSWMIINYDAFPLFSDLGIENMSIQEKVKIMKSIGYIRIKNISKKDFYDDDKVTSFVSMRKNANNKHVFISLLDDNMFVWEDLMIKWIEF